jgi:hypothetical protein
MDTNQKPTVVNKSIAATVMVLLLSLGTWSYFYVKGMPLDAGDTAVVVGFWLIVVLATKWAWGRLVHKRREAPSTK